MQPNRTFTDSLFSPFSMSRIKGSSYRVLTAQK